MPKPSSRHETPRNTLSSQLRDAIAGRRLSATALAAAADLDRRIVARWIAGVKDINLRTADRIAAVLGLRLVETSGRKSPAKTSTLPAPLLPLATEEADRLTTLSQDSEQAQ